MAPNQQILSDLQLIMETDQNFDLLTTYKGVPFTFKAKVQSIEGGQAHIKTAEPTMVCLEHEKKIKLLGSDYFDPSVAEVCSFDILNGLAVLQNFSYLGAKLGERMIVRVEPKDSIEVEIATNDKTTLGVLADLSLSGIGVRISYLDYHSTLKPGTVVQLSLGLPKGPIHPSGTVLSVAKIVGNYRLSVRFKEGEPHRPAIFHYLVDRRAEIEQELKDEYRVTIAVKSEAK